MSSDFETEFLAALGSVVIAVNDLEYALIDLGWIVDGRPQGEWLETLRGRSMGQIKDKVSAAIDDCDFKMVQQEYDNLLARIEMAIDLRNDLLHSVWLPHQAKELVTASKLPKRKGNRTPTNMPHEFEKEMKLEDIYAFVEVFRDLEEEVLEVRDRAVEVRGGLPSQKAWGIVVTSEGKRGRIVYPD